MRIVDLIAFASLMAATLATERAVAQPAPRPRVAIAAGALQGTKPPDAPGAVFKGIPFAQPPVGLLRWREPLAASRWQGTKEASAFGPACAQNSRTGPVGEEDCLYLNVWTPQWPVRGKAPVMLWLFGGANSNGSGVNPLFDGAALAKRGVVVVTINHRVGVMGFLAHPALSAESRHDSSGNYALLDQIAALRWVRDNIGKFGGDARRVTVFAQSSGSYDLLLLMTSPLAKGLFANAIAESGQFLSYDGPMPKVRAEDIGVKISADLGAPEGAAALPFLRALTPAQVMAAESKWLPTAPGTDTGLMTNIDGWVLPEPPARVFLQGRQLAVPLLIGNNAREISPPTSVDDLRRQIVVKYGDLAPKAIEAYGLADGGQGNTDPLLGGPGAQWMTDIVQRCAAIMEADWHVAAGRPTWRYQFERSIPGRETAGASHGAEVAFVFGNMAGPDRPPFTAADRQASDQIQTYWTQFAKTGNPNSDGLPNWPRAEGGRYLAFTADGAVVKDKLQPGPCAVYREWTLRRLAD